MHACMTPGVCAHTHAQWGAVTPTSVAAGRLLANSGAVSAHAATGTATETTDGSSRSLRVGTDEIWPWIHSIVVVTSPAAWREGGGGSVPPMA